jgi:hypothetical protein
LRLARKCIHFGGAVDGVSKEVDETPKEQNYYWRWLIQIGRQARSNVRELVVGLIIALAILLLQVHNGTLVVTDFRPDAISTFWPYIAAIGLYVAYAAIRAPLILDRERATTIGNRENDLATIRAAQAASGPYTPSQLATLGRLSRDGREQYKITISPNSPNPRQEVDLWLKNHLDWREEVLSILSDRDIVAFQRPVTASYETTGTQGTSNQIQGIQRGHLLAELDRLDKIIKRHQPS